jgi:hypothetical protein
MSDIPPDPGWWRASDGNWYPPETHPQTRGPADAIPSSGARSSRSRLMDLRHAWWKNLGDNLKTPVVCLLGVLVVFATILSIQPNHHNPPCGGSNIVVALHGPQGAYANAPGTGGCQTAAILDVAGATLFLTLFIAYLVAALISRRQHRDGGRRDLAGN